jgi:hypothetical protein
MLIYSPQTPASGGFIPGKTIRVRFGNLCFLAHYITNLKELPSLRWREFLGNISHFALCIIVTHSTKYLYYEN